MSAELSDISRSPSIAIRQLAIGRNARCGIALPDLRRDKQLLKRLLRSISAIFAGQFLNIVGNLLLVPLFLSRWSTSMYGEWMALSAVVAYFGVTDLGMNLAATNAMTAAYARSDLGRYRYLQGSAMAFYVGMAFSISFLFGFLTAVLPIPAWIGIRHIPPTVAAGVTWLLATRILWQMPAAQLLSIYRTTGNLAATHWLYNLQSVGLMAVTATVILLQGDVLRLAVWGTAPMIMVTVGAWFRLRSSHPELLPKLSEARISGLRELLGPSLLFGLIMLSMALTLQGPVLLVSKVLGGTAVALLITTRTLANVVRQMVAPVQAALWPELTRLDAVGAEGVLRLGHRLLVIGSVTLSAAFAGALWFEGASVIGVWTLGKLAADVWLLRIFLLAIVLQATWLPSSLFMMANNQHRRLAHSYFISAVVTLAATALLVHPCGLLAAPVGALIGEALACYHFVIKNTCNVLKEEYSRFAARLWSGVAAISCAAWGAGYLGHSVAIGPAPLRWLEVGALTTLAAVLAAWGVALRKNDRSRVAIWGKSRWSALRPTAVELAA
jgi:O-antigen/teichoic acid export membrane protein